MLKSEPAIVYKRGKKAPPSQAQYDRMVRAHRKEIREATARLASGELTPHQWADEIHSILASGHARGYVMGAQLAGGEGVQDATIYGQTAAALEGQYLAAFQNALEDKTGPYYDEDGNLLADRVLSRADLYTGKFRASAAQGFVDAGDRDEEYEWVLGATEQHCSDCPEMAALSPYTASTLFAFPGDGSTQCLGNCLCRLVRVSDGKEVFGPL